MKNRAFLVSLTAAAVLIAAPTSTQFDKVVSIAKGVKKISDIKVTDAEERQIGQQVSDRIVEEFGVLQDANVTKYVALVGTVLAQGTSRPGLDWQFVVLDTEGVNAFAAPGGFVHITKGLLGLMKNEAELAGVLAHELTHVTEKHTVNAIQQGGLISVTADSVTPSGGMTQALITQIAQRAYKDILDNAFSRK